MNKIYLYLGPFYLSLIFSLVFVFLFKKKKTVIYLSLIAYLIFSFKFYFSHIFRLGEDWQKSQLSFEEKMSIVSSDQHSFLEDIENFIPLDKGICYPWPSDIAGRYARQLLYPRVVDLGAEDIRSCDFLVLDYSIRKKDYELSKQLTDSDRKIFKSELGEVYKLRIKN